MSSCELALTSGYNIGGVRGCQKRKKMAIVKSLSVGEGDMFYIRHNTDNFSIIDCCIEAGRHNGIVSELKKMSEDKTIKRFISTHPDDDHIRGIARLFSDLEIPNFYCVKNEAYNPEGGDDFDKYCELRNGKSGFYIERDCKRKWMNLSSESDDDERRGGAGINILWPIVKNQDYRSVLSKVKDWCEPNNLSPIIRYSIDKGVSFAWFGDMEATFQEKIKDEIVLPNTDIVFAPHHGRKSGHIVNKWLRELNPKLIVVGEAPSEHLCYYCGYDTITQNTAGDITFVCEGDHTDVYVSNAGYDPDCIKLKNATKVLTKVNHRHNPEYGYYVGTIE